MSDLIKNVSALTTIPANSLSKLIEVSEYCITDAFYSSKLAEKDTTEINIGIGTLLIRHTDDEIKFKFVPSAKLKEELICVLRHNENKLNVILEDSLKETITNTYKDLF